jgi:hypothetical protein
VSVDHKYFSHLRTDCKSSSAIAMVLEGDLADGDLVWARWGGSKTGSAPLWPGQVLPLALANDSQRSQKPGKAAGLKGAAYLVAFFGDGSYGACVS